MENDWFRTRADGNGALEVWLPGTRLEKRVWVLLPAVLGLGFLVSSAPVPLRLVGCGALLACAYVLLRLSEVGVRLTADGVTVVDVLHRRHVGWGEFMGFLGERSGPEGRCVVARRDGSVVRLPGYLEADEMNPTDGESDVSAIDELNRLAGEVRRDAEHATELRERGFVSLVR